MSKNNFRAVHKVIDRVTLNRGYTQGNARYKLSDYENRNGIIFRDYEATDVYITDEKLALLKNDPAIQSIGTIREVRYKNLDDLKKAL